MRDIKIKKQVQTLAKPNKIAEPVVQEITTPVALKSKREVSIYSAILFCFMSLSILCYISMISSSVFYAVEASQLTFNSKNISSTGNQDFSLSEAVTKNVGGRVSYVNKYSDTSISLK
jgi:hypothetical protein